MSTEYYKEKREKNEELQKRLVKSFKIFSEVNKNKKSQYAALERYGYLFQAEESEKHH